ncbi:MAG: methyltransferase [Planctomycetes bacterium]|nr:methyltransferase [Planctomycetota bacterium]
MSSKRSKKKVHSFPDLLQTVAAKLRPPYGIVLGSAAEVAEVIRTLPDGEITCYQMDTFRAARLGESIAERPAATVETCADLWELPLPVQTMIYPVPYSGERSLKLDMIEQAYHVLKPHGTFIVLSPYDRDDFFAPALKKVFGKVHVPMDGDNKVFWCQADGERPRRRHEVAYHVRVDEQTSYCFVSRPGVFGYGFFDAGGRALTEVMELAPGQRVLDLGCGAGTNGILAARQIGPTGFVAFADSNVRAVTLAELNAKAIGVPNFQAVVTHTLTDWPDASFDVILANPPYYAQGTIVRLFVERAKALLRPGGVLYLVTKQLDAAYPIVAEHFPEPELFENRGYVIFRACNDVTTASRAP